MRERESERRRNLQSLSIGGEAREADEEPIVDLVDSLEVGGDGLELNTEAPIAGYGEAVLAHHCDQCTPIVLEDLQPNFLKTKNKSQFGICKTLISICAWNNAYASTYRHRGLGCSK